MTDKSNCGYRYPVLPGISEVTRMSEMPLLWEYFQEYARKKYEQGGNPAQIQKLIDHVTETLQETIRQLELLPDDALLAEREPDALEAIRRCRPACRNKIPYRWEETVYRRKLLGAVYGRFAGCTLGAPVEFWSVEEMEDWAAYCRQDFPPREYWRKTKKPGDLRYETSIFEEYEKDRLTKVPVDDDVTYTILNLLVLREYGADFTTKQVGEAWKKYLPRACTAEEVVLNHLHSGVPAEQAADLDNPYAQWIGADIRADVWGYVAPGLPEQAAAMAYQDAYLTHRRNGIYGEMYYSSVIAAAFAVEPAKDGGSEQMKLILQKGLEEIPENCLLARDIRWALKTASSIRDYREARKAAEEYFDGMSGVHTNLNACLTIWGLLLGGRDFSKVIGDVTAMGYDNDCNAATAGSIFGALYGVDMIPKEWYVCFQNQVCTYLNGVPRLEITQVCEELLKFAWENHAKSCTNSNHCNRYQGELY